MGKLLLSFIALLFLVSTNLFAQDQKKISDIEEWIRAAVPKMPEKDVKAFANSMLGDEPYGLGVDSKKQDSVPEGTITKYHWVNKTIYIGTQREYWVYVPKQYDSSKPACLMVFQDGIEHYLGPDVQANIVFDNLIYSGDIPVIIGLFINPGDKGPGTPDYGGTDNKCATTIMKEFLITC
jgi:enterochelin esterase family protein